MLSPILEKIFQALPLIIISALLHAHLLVHSKYFEFEVIKESISHFF